MALLINCTTKIGAFATMKHLNQYVMPLQDAVQVDYCKATLRINIAALILNNTGTQKTLMLLNSVFCMIYHKLTEVTL